MINYEFNIMKKNLSWTTLLIIGVLGKLVGYLLLPYQETPSD